MKEYIVKAYLQTSRGYSSDRVIVDPDINTEFISACRSLGLTSTDEELNLALLNLRKSGGFKGLNRSKQTTFDDTGEYKFASEIAVRFIERREQVSLDVILCRPSLRNEFDSIVAKIVPGYSVLKYRWAALRLRKSKQLRPELLSRVIKPVLVKSFRIGVDDLKGQIPKQQGLYLFFSKSQSLYAGETENLLTRIEKHLDHSDNKGLARWLWDNEDEEIFLEIQTLPQDVSTRMRKAMESELIRSRTPLFNVSQ